MSVLKTLLPAVVVTCVVMAPCGEAQADELFFVAAEAGIMAPLNEPYSDTYGLGARGGIGVFRSLVPQLALGLRAEYGALVEESEVQAGGYNFGALTAVGRVRPLAEADDPGRASGLWLEIGVGPSRVENETRALFSPAIGYSFPVGSVGIGPFARYTQIIEDDFADARLGVLGIEVTLFGSGARRNTGPDRTAAAATNDRDRDGIPDDRDRCPDQPETFNGMNDHDGCPDQLGVVFTDNRLVIDEAIFFDSNAAELRPGGKSLLAEIVKEYANPAGGWARLRIQGHADSRGSEEHNEQLSRARAQAVKQYLVSQGVPAETLDVEAYGERHPAVPGADTASEYQRNRRVEFVIERK